MIIDELTEEWLEVFEDAKAKGELTSIFFRLSISVLPEGVDPNDERVRKAIEEIRLADVGRTGDTDG